MSKIICKAKRIDEVPFRGKRSLEWRSKDGTPHYYCYGWTYGDTEYLLPVCRSCADNVLHAQEDLEKEMEG